MPARQCVEALPSEGSPSKLRTLHRASRNRFGMNRQNLKMTICRLLLAGGVISLVVTTKRAHHLTLHLTLLSSHDSEEALLASLLGSNGSRRMAVDRVTLRPQRTDYTKTLALLYPPGLLGGYRNQVLRFIAFCVYAKQRNISQVLLPSLLWSTQLDGIGKNVEWFPIPFDWIFDVDHWNTFAPNKLPLLVNRLAADQESDCWTEPSKVGRFELLGDPPRTGLFTDSLNKNITKNRNIHYYLYQDPSHYNATSDSKDANVASPFGGTADTIINHLQRAALRQGSLSPLLNITVPLIKKRIQINPRKVDYSHLIRNCQNPYVYGGGTRAGKLWNDYIGFQQNSARRKTRAGNSTSRSVVPFDTDIWVYRALRPAAQWRKVADQCVSRHASTGKYMALHARVELEIMAHICGNRMNRNLTSIVQHVFQLHEELISQSSLGEAQLQASDLSGLFIAVSRAGMADTQSNGHQKFQAIADENIKSLNRLTSWSQTNRTASNTLQVGFLHQKLPVFECGEKVLQEYYASHPDIPDHGSLLQSAVNFHIAISAEVFIGVEGSSYSTDILTTRYWLGKGNGNYRYTKTGIERVENGGLPQPHSNCKTRQ
jgi:hypothetical protein